MVKSSLVVVLFILVSNTASLSSVKTSDERIEDLEKLVSGLKEMFESCQQDNTNFANDNSVLEVIQEENKYLKRRLKTLEDAVTTSDRQIEKLGARVDELESFNRILKSKVSQTETQFKIKNNESHSALRYLKTVTNKRKKLHKGETLVEPVTLEDDIMKIQSNTTTVDYYKGRFKKTPNKSREERHLRGIRSTLASIPNGAAFSAYISHDSTHITNDYIIHFDTIVTNIGNHYNKHTGAFTAPQHGVYVFSWRLYCYNGGYIYSQLVVNSNVVGAMLTTAEATAVRGTSDLVVVEVNQGDVVFVRTHSTHAHSGDLRSTPDWRSSFSGWKLY